MVYGQGVQWNLVWEKQTGNLLEGALSEAKDGVKDKWRKSVPYYLNVVPQLLFLLFLHYRVIFPDSDIILLA